MEKLKKFLNEDKYISIKEYEKICQECNAKPNYDELNSRNNTYIEKKLIEEKNYLDTIFENSTENIVPDEEQRRIILKDDDYCLINAGAGSGKSTTMAAKVKYLVEKQNIDPREIIMLSFTKKSSEDLDEKVNEVLELGIPVSTFHSLGMKFIRKMYEVPMKIAGDDEKKKIITEYISSLFKNKQKLVTLIELFKNSGTISRGFVDNCYKFNTFEEYFKNYKKRKYENESKIPNGIHEYIENRLNSQTNLYTIKGEKCKSIAEVKIANFLYVNGIEYQYEKIFERKVDEDRAYSPDFTIEYLGKKIYIEYFGLSTFYENNELTKKGIQKYNQIRKKKEYFQEHNNYDFINLDYKTPDGTFIQTLEKELIKRNVQLIPREDDEIFYEIINNNFKQAEFYKFIDLVIKFIEILKNMLVDSVDYIFEKRKKEILEENFTKCYYSNNKDKEAKCRIKVLDILKEIYEFYEENLTQNNMVDYDDMINKSYQYIIREMKEKDQNLKYKYIIVDEYQDITFQRFLFVKRLVEYYDAKLIAVGDDWQSIYSFTGSRLELFNRFNEFFLNSNDQLLLSTTYRYGQELVDISSSFILANKEQSMKKIKSIKHLENPIEIVRYEAYEEEKRINDIVKEIYNENPNYRILLLARTNKCLDNVKKSKYFNQGVNDTIICKDIPEANIEAITIHKAKGLTADQVIVFGLREKVFPSKGEKDFWIFQYFRLDYFYDCLKFDDEEITFTKENYPFAEERRLFYVAITRTRNKVYLVAPKSNEQTSSFVNEIKESIK